MMETKGESGVHLSVWLAAQRNRKPMLFLVLVLALLGIGMTGFLAFRRFFKKISVA